ncbi:MAG: hypothetical protein NVS3B3_08860 [Aquirhabdus sp.]
MSSFAPMIQILARYRALEFHHNPQLAARLSAIQNWQKKRMQHMYTDLFAVPAHHLMTRYFLDQLYGGPDFNVLAEQCERVVSAAKAFEGLFPDSAVSTALKATELAVLAIELDHQLAQLMEHDLLDDRQDPAINDQQMIQLYRLADQANARFRQNDLLDELGVNLDKYVRSKLIYSIFRLSKGLTQCYQLNALYTFMDEGFAAMKPLKSAKVFVGEFTQGERDLIDEIYLGNLNPFARRVKQVTPSHASIA